MGARQLTLSDFYAENGFGQASDHGRRAYPEFPTQDGKLQELYKHVPMTSPALQPIIGQMDLARIHKEQGQHLQVASALAGADALLHQGLAQYAPEGRRWAAIIAIALVALVTWWALDKRAKGKRQPPWLRNRPPKRRRRRRARAADLEDDDPGLDDDDAADEDDDE